MSLTPSSLCQSKRFCAQCNCPGNRKTLKKNTIGRVIEKLEKTKASLRAKVEHCFHVVKCLTKNRKTRYRGLAKNNAQLLTLFGLPNLVLARRYLGSAHTQVTPAI